MFDNDTDRGIDGAVGAAEWERICRAMESEFGEGRFEQGVLRGIELPQGQALPVGQRLRITARAFWAQSGLGNQVGLMKFAVAKAGVTNLTVPAPQPSLDQGYYYPDGDVGVVFASWADFDRWRRAHGKARPGAPRLAVGFAKPQQRRALLDFVCQRGVAPTPPCYVARRQTLQPDRSSYHQCDLSRARGS